MMSSENILIEKFNIPKDVIFLLEKAEEDVREEFKKVERVVEKTNIRFYMLCKRII